MKRISTFLCFCIATMAINVANAQENKRITEQLETKYSLVTYHDTEGGWYSVCKTGYYRDKGNQGACNLQGREIIPPIYDQVNFRASYYIVEKDGKVSIRDVSNRELLPFKYNDVTWSDLDKYGYCDVKLDGKVGMIDRYGKEIVVPQYDRITTFSFKDSEYACITLNGKEGVIDKQGNEIVAPKYDKIATYGFKDSNYATVTLNKKEGVVDKQGNEIIPPEYDAISTWGFKDSDYAYVSLNGKSGVVNKQNVQLVPCQYDYISIFAIEQYAVVVQGKVDKKYSIPSNGRWGAYNLAEQKMIIDCKYSYLSVFREGLASFNIGGIVEYSTSKIDVKGGKWGYIDKTGKEVIPAKYDHANAFSEGVAQVTLNGVTSLLVNPLTGTDLVVGNSSGGTGIDIDIPQITRQNEETFVFIVANESYVGQVANHAINDGNVFKKYCEKRLGVPSQNIRFYEDATYGNLVNMVKRMKDIADTYEGDASIIFYYSGLGATDDKTSESYLLPVDVSFGSLSSTGYSLAKLYEEMNSMKTRLTLLFMDACFSGLNRKGEALISSRGVRIASKKPIPEGNMLAFIASSDDQAAYASDDLKHGVFTYALLEKLQKNKNEVTLKELTDYVITQVKQRSLKENKNLQTPAISVSTQLDDKLSQIKL